MKTNFIIFCVLLLGAPAISHAQSNRTPELGKPGSPCDLETSTYIKISETPDLSGGREFHYQVQNSCLYGDPESTTPEAHLKWLNDVWGGYDTKLHDNYRSMEAAKRLAYQYIFDEFEEFSKSPFAKNRVHEVPCENSENEQIEASVMVPGQNIGLRIRCSAGNPRGSYLWNCVKTEEYYEKLSGKKLHDAICEELTHNGNPKNKNCSLQTEAVVDYVRKLKYENTCIDDLD